MYILSWIRINGARISCRKGLASDCRFAQSAPGGYTVATRRSHGGQSVAVAKGDGHPAASSSRPPSPHHTTSWRHDRAGESNASHTFQNIIKPLYAKWRASTNALLFCKLATLLFINDKLGLISMDVVYFSLCIVLYLYKFVWGREFERIDRRPPEGSS